jgi:hypothetical protein
VHQSNNGSGAPRTIGAVVTQTITPLSQSEADELDRCEVVIRRGLKTFVEVGEALLTIRDRRLYRTTHGTFEEYCRSTWQLSDRHANRLVQAAEVSEALGPIGPKIENEAQARELAPLCDEPEKLRETWKRANEATRGKPTAAAVREAREQVRPAPPRPSSPQPPVRTYSPPPPRPTFSDQPADSPVPARSPLDDTDSDIAAARHCQAFHHVLGQAVALGEFDLDRIAETVTGDYRESALLLLEGVISSAEQIRNVLRRSNLRVVRESGRR